MIRLLLKVGLLVSSLLLTVYVLYRRAAQHNTTGYLAAIADKQQRADGLKNGPRLLLVGGSGTAFSVDSQVLEDSLHRPVVNLAMHAGLGLTFMLRQVQTAARPGDVVLLTPEYFLSDGDDYTQFYTSELYAPALEFMTFENPLNYLARRAGYCLKRIQTSLFLGTDDQRGATITDTTSVYFRAGFSHRGDLLSPLNNRRSVTIGQIRVTPRAYAGEIALINATVANLRRRGVTTVLTYPAFAESQYIANKTTIDQYVSRLRQLRAVTLVGKPELATYPDTCFFDSPYHLHGLSRRAHSEQLARQLKAATQLPPGSQPIASTR